MEITEIIKDIDAEIAKLEAQAKEIRRTEKLAYDCRYAKKVGECERKLDAIYRTINALRSSKAQAIARTA